MTVPVIDDALVEGDETFGLTIFDGVGYTAGTPRVAVITIHDNDTLPPVPTVEITSAQDATEGGNAGNFVLAVGSGMGPLQAPLTINFALTGTANTGTDSISARNFIVPFRG